MFLLFSQRFWFPSEGKLPKIRLLFFLFLLFKSFQLIIVTFLTYFHPFNLYRYIFVQFLTELFLTQSTKFRRFTLFFLHWQAVRANRRIYTFISSFSCFTINDVVAFLTGRNQGKDVLIVKQHVFIGISLRYGLLNEMKALLIDECVVIESNTAIFEPISTLNAWPEVKGKLLGLLE